LRNLGFSPRFRSGPNRRRCSTGTLAKYLMYRPMWHIPARRSSPAPPRGPLCALVVAGGAPVLSASRRSGPRPRGRPAPRKRPTREGETDTPLPFLLCLLPSTLKAPSLRRSRPRPRGRLPPRKRPTREAEIHAPRSLSSSSPLPSALKAPSPGPSPAPQAAHQRSEDPHTPLPVLLFPLPFGAQGPLPSALKAPSSGPFPTPQAAHQRSGDPPAQSRHRGRYSAFSRRRWYTCPAGKPETLGPATPAGAATGAAMVTATPTQNKQYPAQPGTLAEPYGDRDLPARTGKPAQRPGPVPEDQGVGPAD
jgi:hypothetical protein